MSCDLTGTWRSRQPTSLQACSRRIWTRALSAELLSPMDNVQVVGPVDFDAWLCAEQRKPRPLSRATAIPRPAATVRNTGRSGSGTRTGTLLLYVARTDQRTDNGARERTHDFHATECEPDSESLVSSCASATGATTTAGAAAK